MNSGIPSELPWTIAELPVFGDLFELKRVFFEPTRKIVARGLGLVDRNSYDDSCIGIVLEVICLRLKHRGPQWPALGLSQDRGGMTIRGSAQLGSAHGVFDVGIHGPR